MSNELQTFVSVGDILIQCESDTKDLFDGVRGEISGADIALGQLESVYTDRGQPTYVDPFVTQVAGMPPHQIKDIRDAGFDVLTLCGNHAWDLGREGVEDTIAACDKYGLIHTGAGMNLEEARRPAIVDVHGVKYGFLGYNCTGPAGSWAQEDKPGCNYIHSVTAFEYPVPNIGGIPARYSYPVEDDLERMQRAVNDLREQVDILSVSIHKGVGFIPAAISLHEHIIARAAIDAGADVVFGHHGHLLKGVETYKGKAIFHDLGNFMAAGDLNGEKYFRYGSKKEHRVQNKSYTYEQKIQREKEFNLRNGGPFVWGPLGTTVSWPVPETIYTMIAKCYVRNKVIEKVTYVPCIFDDDGYVTILTAAQEEAQNLFTYISNITAHAHMDTKYEWDGDEIRIVF
ncbi:MAG: CapA family protein [Clostridiales Family XIII bacterium]|jgi:poly-gamma-glutamate synthesis protein (capsule biosynthesis protein)|nr:CapA family protein [Clostridiales Family XIII bacterium]